MEKRSHQLYKELEEASKNGVLIYQGSKQVSPEDISHTHWVREEMAYVPDFIVMDEAGELKEIWYGSDKSNKRK